MKQLQIALTLLTLISSAILQQDVRTGQAKNISLENNIAELHAVLRMIEKFTEANEIADGVQEGECCLGFLIYY